MSYTIRREIVVSILFFLIFILTGCGKKEKQSVNNEMKFNIDSSKLSSVVTDTLFKFKFNPPIYWEKIGSKEIDIARKAINKVLAKKNQITVRPLYIFVKDTNKAILNIAEIDFDSGKISFDMRIAEYEKIMFEGHDTSKVRKAVYTKSGIKIVQFLIMENGFVNFRLLFENGEGNLLQFDYLSKSEDYSNEVKAIESSIGSIKLI